MTITDVLLLSRSKDSRLCFLHNTNRRKVIDGTSQSLSTYHPHRPGVSSPGNNLLSGVWSSGQSRGHRTWSRIRETSYATTYCVGESSQASNPALEATSSSRDLTDFIGHIQVKSRTVPTPQHQSIKIRMNKDPAPLVKKSGVNATSVSRLSKKKEHATQPPKDPTNLFKTGARTILESKQLTRKGTTRPLKDPAGLPKRSAISRIRTSMQFIKKKLTIQPARKPTEVNNGETSRILASKHVMRKKETARPHKGPVGFVKNIGTSRIPSSIHGMQRKKAIHSPKGSAVWVKKSETTTEIPTLKQFTRRKEKDQPSKGSAGLVSKSGTGKTVPSTLVIRKKETIPDNPRQRQHVCKDHIVWEGFEERIELLERSCLLCDGDLANEPEYDPDMEPINPAEIAVLSCGHVFHSLCLLLATAEEKSRDPPCIICASILS